MLNSHSKQIGTITITAMKRTKKKKDEQPRRDKTEVPPGTASNETILGLQLVCGRPTLALSSALVPQTLSCLFCVEDS